MSGVEATFSGINSANGNFWGTNNGIGLDYAGGYGNQFKMSFNQAVKFLSYDVIASGITPGETATFDLSNPNGTGSTGNDLATVGTFNLSNQFNLNAGQISTLTATLSNTLDNTANIQSITVDATPVPWETDALSVVGSTILFGFGVWSKRKSTKSFNK